MGSIWALFGLYLGSRPGSVVRGSINAQRKGLTLLPPCPRRLPLTPSPLSHSNPSLPPPPLHPCRPSTSFLFPFWAIGKKQNVVKACLRWALLKFPGSGDSWGAQESAWQKRNAREACQVSSDLIPVSAKKTPIRKQRCMSSCHPAPRSSMLRLRSPLMMRRRWAFFSQGVTPPGNATQH